MTSRDFRAIAATIADLRDFIPDLDADQLREIARQFADLCAQTNPRFDRERFMAAATGAPLTKGDAPRARDYARS